MSLLAQLAGRIMTMGTLPVRSSLTQMVVRFKHGPKTNRSAAKRFRVRASGSIKRNKAGRSHNTGYKTRQRTNRLGSSTGISGKKIEKNVRKLLGLMK